MSYTMPEFLAHAIAMEREAAERYLELADMMEAHNNLEVASLFRDMVRYSNMHGDSIVERAAGVGDASRREAEGTRRGARPDEAELPLGAPRRRGRGRIEACP